MKKRILWGVVSICSLFCVSAYAGEKLSDLIEIHRNTEGLPSFRVKKEGYSVETGNSETEPVFLRCVGPYDYVDVVVRTETGGAYISQYGEYPEPKPILTEAAAVRSKILKWQSFELGKISYNSETNRIDMDSKSENEYDILSCSKVISLTK